MYSRMPKIKINEFLAGVLAAFVRVSTRVENYRITPNVVCGNFIRRGAAASFGSLIVDLKLIQYCMSNVLLLPLGAAKVSIQSVSSVKYRVTT